MTDTTRTFGVLEVGGARLAVPLAELREVVPRPAELLVLPVRGPGVLGAIDLRRQVIPVVDLRTLLGLPPQSRPDQVVMVAVRDGRALGLVADSVVGVCSTDDEQLHPIAAAGDEGLLVSHTFVRPEAEDGGMVSVLDLAAVMRLPGLPLVEEQAASAVGAAWSADTDTRSLLLARSGRTALAVDIEHVHATLPYLDIRPSPLAHGSCRGVVDYGDVEVPVLDPLDLMGLGTLGRERSQGLLFRTDRGLVVLLLTDILEIVHVPRDRVLPLPPLAVHRPDLFEGVLRDAELGEFLVLKAEQVLADPGLQALSGLNTDHAAGDAVVVQLGGSAAGTGAAGTASTDDGARRDVYLTYSVGRDQATALEQILEILPYPAGIAPLDDGQDAMIGVLTHRDDVVPLVCLATLAGRPERPDPATACVLVVGVPDHEHPGRHTSRIGLVVLGLRAIERSIWEEDPDDRPRRGGGDPLQAALADQRLIRTATIGADDEPRMLARVDLVTIATALAAQYRGAPTASRAAPLESLRAG